LPVVRTVRQGLIRLLPIAVAVALLYYIFRVVPLSAVADALGAAQSAEVLAGLGLLFVTRLLAALRMKLLTDRQGLSFSPVELFQIGTTATFYGLVLPGTISGGLIRWYKLAKQGEPVRALAALTWDRLADAAALAAIGVGAWLFSRPSGPHAVVGPGLAAVLAALFALYLAGFSHRIGGLLLRPIESIGRRLGNRWGSTKLVEAAAAARRYHKAEPGFPYVVAGLSLASQLSGAVAFLLWARSLGMGIGFAELTWPRVCYMLVVLLPITFAGLGTREGILILLLRPYGVSGAEAVAVAFVQLGATLVMAAIGGLSELKGFLTGAGHDRARARS
jgi:uncharacterized protein (TIRG00374 family)